MLWIKKLNILLGTKSLLIFLLSLIERIWFHYLDLIQLTRTCCPSIGSDVARPLGTLVILNMGILMFDLYFEWVVVEIYSLFSYSHIW